MGVFRNIGKAARHIWNVHGSTILTASSWGFTGIATITAYRFGKREGQHPSEKPKDWLIQASLPAGAAVASMACSGISHYKDAATIGALVAETAFNDKKRKEMMKDIEDFVGKENMDKFRQSLHPEPVIPNDIPEDKFVWIDDLTGSKTIASLAEIVEAEYAVNRLNRERGYVSLGDWYEFANFPHVKKGDLPLSEDDYGISLNGCGDEDLGWTEYAQGTYGYSWIDFKHVECKDKDGKVYYIIEYPWPPHADYLTL